MLYRLRQTDGDNYLFGNWIRRDGATDRSIRPTYR